MGSGKYDRRITIQKFTETENEYGETEQSWSDNGTISANLNYGSGGERRVGAAQEQANLPVTISVRLSSFTTTLTPANARLSFGGNVWDIESVAPGPKRGREIIIIARARVS